MTRNSETEITPKDPDLDPMQPHAPCAHAGKPSLKLLCSDDLTLMRSSTSDLHAQSFSPPREPESMPASLYAEVANAYG